MIPPTSGSTQSRRSAARPSPTVHLSFAAFALLAGAAWVLSSNGAEQVPSTVVHAWAIVHVSVSTGLLALAARGLGAEARVASLARIAAPIEIALVLAWYAVFGASATAVLTILPLLVVAHCAEGRGIGRASVAVAAAGLLLVGAADALRLLPHAPSSADAALPASAIAHTLFIVAVVGLAYGLGAKLAATRGAANEAPRRPPTLATKAARPHGRHAGRELAGLRIGELIGHGGMGDVYRAERLADSRVVAVKVLHAHLGTPKTLERFFREVDVVSRLPEGRVAAVLDHGSTPEGDHYVVMELLRGEDLSERLHRVQCMPLAEVLPLTDQLAEVLDAAAAIGVVHRDVKPRNIFLVGDREGPVDVRLLDFGICRLLDPGPGGELHRTAALLGTPGYLAPEQVADGFGEIGPHTDVFGLGAVLYRALTGSSAFPSRQPAVAAYEALNYHPAPVSEVASHLPADLDAVLAIALAKAPRDRYARAGELARDLRAAAVGDLPAEVRERAAKLAADRALHQSTITSAA